MLNKINISYKEKILIIYIVLAVTTLTVFWQVNQYDFNSLDDQVYVTENNHVLSGITLDGFRWAFSTTYAEFWHPLTWLSLMLDYQLYGLNAGGYHMTNLILHILSTLLLFWLFKHMTGEIWKSAFLAALFALHPLRVESVAWIAERKDVLSAFFWMLTLCLYVSYTEKPVIRRYLLVLFSFVCGLMSKSMVVTLPVVMILLDYWPLGRFESKKGNLILWQVKEKIPFFIFSSVFSILSIYAQPRPSLPLKDWPFPWEERIINAFISFVIYLEKTFWPHDLAICYPFFGHAPLWEVSGASSLIIFISIAVMLTMKRLPYLFVGWLWYSITVLPIIGIIPVGNNAMADRYIYLPSIGIAVILAWGAPLLFTREGMHKKILFPAGITFLAFMAILTWQQCGYWKNSITLYSHALQVNKDSYIAHNNLGLTLFHEGKTEDAIYHYNKALRIKTNYSHAYLNRGIANFKLGQYKLAIEDFNQAIRLQPSSDKAYSNRGTVYVKLGQNSRAIEDFSKAIELKPDYANAYNIRGVAYLNLGHYKQAIEDYNKAIRLKPDYADAYNNRGLAHFIQSNNNLGCHDVQKACKLGNCQLLEKAIRRSGCH